MSKQEGKARYGNAAGSWHQVVSRSSSEDALGGVSKESQQVEQGAPSVNHPNDPPAKGKLSLDHYSKSYEAYNQQSGQSVPASGPVWRQYSEWKISCGRNRLELSAEPQQNKDRW